MFFVPAILIAVMWVATLIAVKDAPSQAGYNDFDTGDASSGDDGPQLSAVQVFKMMLTNRVIVTIACIEFCSGFLRQAIMQLYMIFAKQTGIFETFVPQNWGLLLCCAAASGLLLGLAALGVRLLGLLRLPLGLLQTPRACRRGRGSPERPPASAARSRRSPYQDPARSERRQLTAEAVRWPPALEELLRFVKEANDLRKTVIHTIGIGDFPPELLKRLAESNGGVYVNLGR